MIAVRRRSARAWMCRLGLHPFVPQGYGGAGWWLVRCPRCGVEDIA